MEKLPTKWCVEVTPENKDILTQWKLEVSKGTYDASAYYYVDWQGCNTTNISDCPVISWGDFQRLILKIKPKKSILELTGTEVIHAPTQKIAWKLCQKLDELGLKWADGYRWLANTRYLSFGGNTCYHPALGQYSSIQHYSNLGYTILTIDDLRDFDTEPKTNKMQTSRQDLLSIYKKDDCGRFNYEIETLLKEVSLLTDTEKFDIPQEYINKLPQCNKNQLELLASIGIKPQEIGWSRDTLNTKPYVYFDRDGKNKALRLQTGDGDRKIVYTFENITIAEQELKIHNLMLLMRNWARFHNQLDGFVPDWTSSNQSKYGIRLYSRVIDTDSADRLNRFLFHISVSSLERAKEMLKEFKKEIEEIMPYL